MRRLMIFAAGAIVGIAATIGVNAWTESVAASSNDKSGSRVVLENDRVRVKEAVFAPGERPGMHTHAQPHVGVVIDGGKLKFNYPDGKTETLDLKRGGTGYRDANVTHEAVNMGSKPIRVIEVEIK